MVKKWKVLKKYQCSITKEVCFYNEEFINYEDSPDIDCKNCKHYNLWKNRNRKVKKVGLKQKNKAEGWF